AGKFELVGLFQSKEIANAGCRRRAQAADRQVARDDPVNSVPDLVLTAERQCRAARVVPPVAGNHRWNSGQAEVDLTREIQTSEPHQTIAVWSVGKVDAGVESQARHQAELVIDMRDDGVDPAWIIEDLYVLEGRSVKPAGPE